MDSLFEKLFHNIPSFIALFDPEDHRFIQINQFGLDLFEIRSCADFTDAFLAGKIWSTPPPEWLECWAGMVQVVSGPGYIEKEERYQTAQGKQFWGLLHVDDISINGRDLLLVKITNIDHFKKSELADIRNAKQLQALFNNSTIGIVIADREGIIINFNQFAEKQFGYTKDELLGQPVEALIPAQFRNMHKEHRRQFIQHPQTRMMGAGRDLYARRKNSTEFPVEISLSHYRIEDENYVIAFIVDISVRKRNEEIVLRQKEELEKISAQIKLMNQELEKKVEDRTKMLKETLVELEKSKEELHAALEKEIELGELKSRFVTMASHEFRTPLSTILSSSYIAQQYTSADDQQKREKHLLKIQNAVQNLTFILEDFLSLEKLDEGLVQLKPETLTAKELLDKVAGVTEEMENILKKGQQIEIAHTDLPEITTDKKLLRNILINLISNAIKYSPEQSLIKVNVTCDNGHLKISVSDQGIGIPAEDQKHLFQRFFRAKNAANIQGTGLGLHIVSRYLKLINGKIEMQSEANKGTTFTVLLDTRTSVKNILSNLKSMPTRR